MPGDWCSGGRGVDWKVGIAAHSHEYEEDDDQFSCFMNCGPTQRRPLKGIKVEISTEVTDGNRDLSS